MSRFRFAFWVLVLIWPLGIVHGEVVSITASRDNTLYEHTMGELSNGAGHFLFAGTAGGGDVRRGLLFFDLGGSVPIGSTIDEATLTLSMSRTSSGPQTVSLFRVSSDWGEGDSDADGSEGGGAASAIGDATWVHRFFDQTPWTQNGGDFDPQVRAASVVGNLGSYSWTSDLLRGDVQNWLDNPQQNFGWLLMGNEEGAGTAKRFDSHENPLVSARPTITLHYTIPEPGSFGLGALGLVSMIFWRRRSQG